MVGGWSVWSCLDWVKGLDFRSFLWVEEVFGIMGFLGEIFERLGICVEVGGILDISGCLVIKWVFIIRGDWEIRAFLDVKNFLELRRFFNVRSCFELGWILGIESFLGVGGIFGVKNCIGVDLFLEIWICLEEGKVCGVRRFLELERIFIFWRWVRVWVGGNFDICKRVEGILNIEDFLIMGVDDVGNCLGFDVMDFLEGREVFDF